MGNNFLISMLGWVLVAGSTCGIAFYCWFWVFVWLGGLTWVFCIGEFGLLF